ncbi:Iron-siderophore ABC transporter substrate-binding protein OS=Streptomyces cyaneofuscatus OX=66883 GN=G3I52_25715 PE=3 SV=1 [Streptomyces cyaneofuscatus]
MTPIGIPATDISNDPLYEAVPSVKAGNSLIFDDQIISQAFTTDSVLSVSYALEKVVPLFAEKVKK